MAALAERPLTRTAPRERMAVHNETLGVAVDRLVTAGRLVRIEDGLAVPVAPYRDGRERNEPQEACITRP